MRTVIIVVCALFALISIKGYMYLNQKHIDIDDEEFVSATSSQLFEDFETNETIANAQYLGKILEVTGTVSEVLTNQNGETVILLNSKGGLFGVSCTMEKEISSPPVDKQITVKGICTGYLSDVVITRGLLIEN